MDGGGGGFGGIEGFTSCHFFGRNDGWDIPFVCCQTTK